MSNYCNTAAIPAWFDDAIKHITDRIKDSETSHEVRSDILSQLITDTSVKDTDVEQLRVLIHEWDIFSNGDILGYIFQMLFTKKEKKVKGQYFTPGHIVESLVDNLVRSHDTLSTFRVLDPACGSGQFLLSAFKQLITLYMQAGIPYDEAVYLIAVNNLFGSDYDPLAVTIARYNISRISGVPSDRLQNITCCNFLATDSLFGSFPFKSNQFDTIIGNPPWGSSLQPSEKKHYRKVYESARSGINTFTLFMERSVDLVKESGTVRFVIPEAYLNIKAHNNSRLFYLNNTKIERIDILGEQFKDVYAPSLTIIAEKCSSEIERNNNIVRIKKNQQDGKREFSSIPQKYYYSTFQNIMNINYTPKSASLIDKIKADDNLYLEKNASFFLGVVTGNNESMVSTTCTDIHPHPIIIGKDVSRFKINFSGHYFKFSPDTLQQVAPEHLYKAEKKIMYKFIGKNLTFAIDYDGFYSLNNVNGFIPHIKNCSPEYITALFNSSVMQYYYDQTFFTLKVLKGNLEKLPIKTASSQDMKKITSITHALSLTSSADEEENYRSILDDMFMSIYRIKDRDAYKMMEEGQVGLFQE